jgi:hypothetical protein
MYGLSRSGTESRQRKLADLNKINMLSSGTALAVVWTAAGATAPAKAATQPGGGQ